MQARSSSACDSPATHSVRCEVDGVTYDHDLIIDRGKIRKRKKAASRGFRGGYGHTPLSAAEDIPWRCRRLVIGTGADGALPVMKQVREQARRRGRPGHPAHGPGDQRTGRDHQGHQRHLAPDMLTASGRSPATSPGRDGVGGGPVPARHHHGLCAAEQAGLTWVSSIAARRTFPWPRSGGPRAPTGPSRSCAGARSATPAACSTRRRTSRAVPQPAPVPARLVVRRQWQGRPAPAALLRQQPPAPPRPPGGHCVQRRRRARRGPVPRRRHHRSRLLAHRPPVHRRGPEPAWLLASQPPGCSQNTPGWMIASRRCIPPWAARACAAGHCGPGRAPARAVRRGVTGDQDRDGRLAQTIVI